MQTIKIGPTEPITATFPDNLEITGDEFCYKVVATDGDGDLYNVCKAEGVLIELEKDLDLSKFNSDTKILLEIALKTRKIKILNKKIMVLDVLFVEMLFRGCKVSNKMIEFLKKYCKDNDYEYIILMAKPIITYKCGISRVQSSGYEKEMQSIINNLYLNNGFDWFNKAKKTMFFKI